MKHATFYITLLLLAVSPCFGGYLMIHEKGKQMPTDLMGPFVVTEDGTIICVNNGAVYRSADGGNTWNSKPVLDKERFVDLDERAILRTQEGTIIFAFMNDKERAYGKENKGKWGEGNIDDFILPCYTIRSTDGGLTWSEPLQIQRRWCGALRCMIQLESGRIVLVGQSVIPWSHTTLTYTSDDQGLSWKASNEIYIGDAQSHDHDGAMEATILERKDGSIYMLIRTTTGFLHESVSADGGRTWTEPKPTSMRNSHCCATMTRLSDGRISMLWNATPVKADIFGSREELSVAFSEDDAKTWSKPVVVAARYFKEGDPWVDNQVSYPYLCEVKPGVFWITSMFGGLRMKINENDVQVEKTIAFGVHSEGHRQVSGIYPHLAMFNNEAECGTGAVVVWADRIWVTTYGPHLPLGSSDKLYEITPQLEQIIRPESVGGTHANRFIHRETEQLFIGLYAIDKDRNIRTILPKRMPGRQTGVARHLTDPVGKVYFATMEEGLYEVDVKTLDVVGLIKDGNTNQGAEEVKPATIGSRLPGYHGNGFFMGQDRVVYSNNGDNDPRRLTDPTIPSGALAEWTGEGDWKMVRRNQFCEVSGPGGISGGISGNENPDTDPIWSTGWDYRSLILMALDKGKWTAYRLPKTSHCYDGSHGWHTEWPRIREIGEGENLLMTMHGAFWKFPKRFTPSSSSGIEMRSTYLKVIGDFTRWNDRIVFACDDSAKSEFTNKRNVKGNLAGPGQSNSNLWFVEPTQLDKFGPLLGRGSVWQTEDVPAGQYSEPFWIGNDVFSHRTLYLKHDGAEPVALAVEIDKRGTGEWVNASSMTATNFTVLTPNFEGVWVRFKPATDMKNASVMFQYRGADNRSITPDKKFSGLATLDDTKVSGGVMLVRGADFRTLRCIIHNEGGLLGVYDLDGDMKLTKKDDPAGLQWTSQNGAIPENVITYDAASVLVIDDTGKRWRLPKGDSKRDEAGPLGFERVCREVSTERDLFHAHGTFYELPAENSGGFEKIRPVASHPYRIKDYASYRGMLVISGLGMEAGTENPHIVRSDDGKCALWCGVIDDLWSLGKVRGVGGPWKATAVEAGVPSDPYLMTGYDKKMLTLSHTTSESVAFRIELDVCGNGQWATWKTVSVAPRSEEKLDIPVDAYWVRLVADKNTTATATFVYE